MTGYYRIHTPLSYGNEILHANTIRWLRLKPENITKLIEVGFISPVRTPPLTEIPELKDFADKLSKLNIITVQQFLEAQPETLKSIWRRQDHIDKHKQNIIETYLLVEQKEKPCNC